ncbi:hypothetical protein CF319_g2171 [Tilletia indica]|uniref:Uncharacterized protein n=1 Tax=Tilletia indica TaxID=43049 RepID=A0A177TUU7_9BASI|nr:hypothetical protein CF319_g2171 [Tilletia indica]KAE8258467.1 hypothetical protein A4X13_0g1668 [Tilletia indica]
MTRPGSRRIGAKVRRLARVILATSTEPHVSRLSLTSIESESQKRSLLERIQPTIEILAESKAFPANRKEQEGLILEVPRS